MTSPAVSSSMPAIDAEINAESVEAPIPFNLNLHAARLLMREPFFAALSRRIDKTPTTAIPTAGVRVNPHTAQLEMLYNPAFFGKLTDKQVAGILKRYCISNSGITI